MSELRNFIFEHEEAFRSKPRLASLYADFARLRASNPDGYAANCAAWRGALERATRRGLTSAYGVKDASNGDSLILGTGEDLLRALETDDAGRPLSLGSVINEAVADGTLLPLQEFLSATTSVYRRGWLSAVPSVSTLARWLLSQITSGTGGDGYTVPRGRFVVLKNVEEASQAILKKVAETASTPTSLVYSLDTFMDGFASVRSDAPRLTRDDAVVVLKHLSRDKLAATLGTDAKGEITAVKLVAPTSQQAPTPVSEHDRTIASLQSLMMKLRIQIDALAPRIAELDKTTRTELAAGRRDRALAALRRRKALEATVSKREASFAQTEDVLTSIDEAAGQVEMVAAMEASAGVLRSLNAQVGGAARVDAVVDAMREGMADTDEVSRILAEPGAQDVDEEEVGGELAALEAETEAKNKAEKQKDDEKKTADLLEGAPQVPTTPVAEQRPDGRETAAGLENRFDALSL